MSKRLILLACAFSVLLACKGKSPAENPRSETVETPKGDRPESPAAKGGSQVFPLDPKLFLEPLPADFERPDLNLENRAWRGGLKASMPAAYLSEPMEFQDLPSLPPGATKLAVTASDLAILYRNPFESPVSDASRLSRLEVLVPIPFGTILPILAAYEDPSPKPEYDGLVSFEDELNYFYLTEYRGRKGVVFGADLAGLGEKPEEIMKLAYYYNKPERATAFVGLSGRSSLPAEVAAGLRKDYIAFAKAPAYDLSVDNPDDLVSVYRDAFSDRAATVFLTTDLFAHCLHLLFDRMLAAVEQERFVPLLKAIVQGYLDEIGKKQAADGGKSPEYTKALGRAYAYFSVGKALIAMAVETPKADGYGQGAGDSGERDIDASSLLAEGPDGYAFPENVRAEISLILEAKGFAKSPNFLYTEDYSQFKPRGHYTKNPRLKAYFRTMMFFGRLNFYLDFSTEPAAAVSRELGPVALIVNQMHFSQPRLRDYWKGLFDPISYLIGESDDIGFNDMDTALREGKGADLEAWFAEGKVIPYLEKLSARLRSPGIQGNVTFGNANGANVAGSGDAFGEPPKGWRLFGQRFTLDSSWTDRLTGKARTMASGLDVAAALGSKFAYDLSFDPKNGNPPDRAVLDRIVVENVRRKPEDWQKTFYNHYLGLSGTMMTFEVGAGFYYSRKPLWNVRVLQSGLSAWAELRHDTILYVKQSYAEKAGGGDYEPTWRTRPFARPIQLVEPNLPFFYGLATLLERGLPLLREGNLLPPAFAAKFRDFHAIVNRLTAVTEMQARDQGIDERENEYLVTVPALLARIILPESGDMVDPKELRMAMVADVHTDSDNGQVLEVATGTPLAIYIAVNDGTGGKRIAKGYTYSYHEFPWPMKDRLDDDQWKDFVYGDPGRGDLEARRPFWLRGILP